MAESRDAVELRERRLRGGGGSGRGLLWRVVFGCMWRWLVPFPVVLFFFAADGGEQAAAPDPARTPARAPRPAKQESGNHAPTSGPRGVGGPRRTTTLEPT